MECLQPLFLPRFKGLSVGKYLTLLHDNNLQPIDIPYYHYVPCCKCAVCRFKDGKKWALRLLETMNKTQNNFFITLTYDDAHLLSENFNIDIPQLNKDHLRSLLLKLKEKLRNEQEKILRRQYKLSSKEAHKRSTFPLYYAIGDYGDHTFRPHYHIILYNVPVDAIELYNIIEKLWLYGFIDVRPLLAEYCNYVVKYLTTNTKQYEWAQRNNLILPFRITSRHLMPDNKRIRKLAKEMDNGFNYIQHGPAKYGIPAYMKKKINQNRAREPGSSKNLYNFYSEVVKDSTNFVGFLEENHYLQNLIKRNFYTDTEINYNEYILKHIINK